MQPQTILIHNIHLPTTMLFLTTLHFTLGNILLHILNLIAILFKQVDKVHLNLMIDFIVILLVVAIQCLVRQCSNRCSELLPILEDHIGDMLERQQQAILLLLHLVVLEQELVSHLLTLAYQVGNYQYDLVYALGQVG